jgi:uroporphyrinogen decarboxylase
MASFTSFFDSALQAANIPKGEFHAARPQIEQLMDILLDNQEQVMRVVCGRFASDLALVVINDRIAHEYGLRIDVETFLEVFAPRMTRLIAPAREHGKLLLMHTLGQMDQALPILYDIGFDAVHPLEPECNDLLVTKRQWAGKLALAGGMPTALLTHGSKDEIEDKVREYCITLAPGGGYLFGSSTGITDEVPPQNLVAMTRAVHKYGRFGTLGVET